MKFQTYIDSIPAGQPIEAADEAAAITEACKRYDGMICREGVLTEHGETITVIDVARGEHPTGAIDLVFPGCPDSDDYDPLNRGYSL